MLFTVAVLFLALLRLLVHGRLVGARAATQGLDIVELLRTGICNLFRVSAKDNSLTPAKGMGSLTSTSNGRKHT